MKPLVKKTLWWSGGGVALLILLVIAVAGWLLFTTSGARWIAGQVTSRFATQVSYSAIDGTIAGGLVVRDFRFTGPPDAARIHIEEMSVRPTLRMLLSRILRIENASVRGLVVTLPTEAGPEEAEDPDKPMWVEAPLDIVVDDFALHDGRIEKGGETLFAVRQLEIAARWTREELRIERLALLPGDIEGRLDVTGRVVPERRLVRADIDAHWKDVVVPEKYAGLVLETAGELHVVGTPEVFAVVGRFDAGPPGDPTHVQVDLQGTPERAEIASLKLEQAAGRLEASGHVEYDPVAWDLEVLARGFDPGKLLADWPGSIDLDAKTRGEIAAEGPRGSLGIASLNGTLRGRPIAGQGDIVFAAPGRLEGDLRVSSGESRVAVRGRSTDGRSADATITLSIASLADWVPDTAGSLDGDFRIRGVWPELTIAGGAQGRALAFAGQRVTRVDVTADVKSPLDPTGDVRVRASDVEAGGYRFASIALDGNGSQKSHRLSLTADSEQLDTAVRVAGGLTDTGWAGDIEELTLDTPNISRLELRDPARVVLSNGDVSIGEACLVQRDSGSALCAAADVRASGELEARYQFDHVQLALANAFAPDALPGDLRGEIAGEGQVRRDADGRLFGEANLESARAELVMREDDPGEFATGQRSLLIYENLQLRARLEGEQATAELNAGLQNGGSLDANFEASSLTADAPAISGRVNASMPTLAPFGGFVPTVDNLDGAVDAQIVVGGTIAAPEITGNVDATRLQADLGTLGIELRDGRVRGEARSDGGFTLAASVASGKGHLELAGTLSERGVIDARILGQNFEAADIPAGKILITPDLALTGDPKGYLLKGEVTIPLAEIDIEKMPKDKAPGVSPDVIVIRNGQVVEQAANEGGLPLRAQILVKLAEPISIVGFGLDATVAGELQVREAPGAPTTGSGQLTVAGTYKKYGQDLTIREGRLLFAGTPLDNPRLAIVAMRRIDANLETGLRIAGSAQAPVVTVISDPNIGEADALSYLVTGRSLNDVGSASGGSQDTLAAATQSLQGAGAGLVAKRIGARLGLDEATVEENDMIGGSALTIGEYLSPRLYLSYGVGLFEPGEVIGLRYKLTDGVGVRIQRGSEETRAGVEYRVEK